MTERKTWQAIALLSLLGLGAAALSTLAWQQTAEKIAANDRAYQLRALNQIVAPTRYNNALFEDTISVREPDLLGSDEAVTVYRARLNGEAVAVILTVVAPRGYSGSIHLLVGINLNGTLAGVRVREHHETAGLGDNIEIEKSNWILSFDQRSLVNPPSEQWAVKADGGEFDQFTGATVTPRAIVTAVHNALIYYQANYDILFEPGQPQ